jgi:hypothetical protein
MNCALFQTASGEKWRFTYMSRTYHHGKDRRLRVRGVRRPTDLRRLARVLIDLEAAKTEAEAEAEHEKQTKTKQMKRRAKTGTDSETSA